MTLSRKNKELPDKPTHRPKKATKKSVLKILVTCTKLVIRLKFSHFYRLCFTDKVI